MEPTVAQDEAMEEDMNAIMAKAGEDKHGEEYMKKAREKAQEKGAPLSPEEKDKLRDQHSKNRKTNEEQDILRLAGL